MYDLFYMGEALKEAKFAFEKEEVPVGAVIVFQNNIIARAHNLVETTRDATMHAEIQCIKKASHVLENWRLLDCTLYTTLEPCAMCGGALILSRISKIIYGAKDFRHGACGGWTNFLNEKHPIHNMVCVGGVLEKEAAALLTEFFQKQRKKAKS